jgi:N-acetylneuraminate synthase
MNQISPAQVIAEVGCVHLGSMDRAKKLISLAKACGADYVKFQKRNPDECVPEHLKNQPHPNQIFAYGKTYLEHRKNLELPIDQHYLLQKYCNDIGIKYACSVWDKTSAIDIISLNPEFIKIPSACNHNRDLIKYILGHFYGDIHISTGMTSLSERTSLVEYLKSLSPKRFVVYHCTSIYPCPFEKLHLLEISKLAESGLRVGFSNHGYGIASDIAAWMLGAKYIERHFIDDRTIRHTDASASLEPEGLRKLCRDLNNVYRAMTRSPELPDEQEIAERNKLRVNE